MLKWIKDLISKIVVKIMFSAKHSDEVFSAVDAMLENDEPVMTDEEFEQAMRELEE